MIHLKYFESSYVIVRWEEKIIKALTTGFLSYIKNIFLEDVDIDELNDDGWTPLMLLAYHSNRTIVDTNCFELFKILIDKGANWNIINNEGDDFIDILNHEKLSESLKNKIIEHYPEKYEEYIMKKELNKYNL